MEAAKVIVVYWHIKGHDATRIDQKLSDWFRKPEPGDDITRRASGSGRLPDDRIDTRITSALE
jgi:hypothetical protein